MFVAWSPCPIAGGYNPNAGMTPAADTVLKFMQQTQGEDDTGLNIADVGVALACIAAAS